jgi:hypothetical protein
MFAGPLAIVYGNCRHGKVALILRGKVGMLGDRRPAEHAPHDDRPVGG